MKVLIIDFSERRFIFQGPIFTFLLLFYNYFIISSIAGILDYKISTLSLIIIILILAVIRLIPMTIERNKTHLITQILTEISGIWLWMSFMYLFEVIFIYIIEYFIQLPYIIRLIIILLVPVFGIIGYYMAHHNYIREYDVNLNEKSDKESKPVTIIHISDLHIGSMRKEKTIKQTIHSINKIAEEKRRENTKVITIISGDIADGSCPIEPDTFMTFKKATMPVIFTPGNHDYYQGIDNVEEALRNAGIIILDNDNLVMDEENINIIGLKFSFSEESEPYQLPIYEDKNNVLIYHVPLYWDTFSKNGIDLQLSGHTHGGQFYPANFFVKRQFPYNHGLFNKEIKQENGKVFNSYLSVTEGIGTFAAPIRLGTRSEIVVLDIKRLPMNK